MIRHLILLLVVLLCLRQGHAQTTDQNYPVTAQAFVVPQPNQKLAAYFASNRALTVSLLLKDLTKTSIQAYLRWSIDGPGVHLSSIDGHIPAHFITLQRGVMQRLSGLDLQSDYFLSNLILAEGLAGPPLRTSLPEGFYTFRVQALEAGTGREVSNWGETYFSITTPLPPVINIPFNEAELIPTEAQKNGVQSVNIQWMPRHYQMPGNTTSYDLKVCKIPDGYEPTEALDACVSPIIDDKGNPGTFYPGNTGIGNSSIGAWEVGAKYAVRVTIHEFDENGDEILFVNEGRSEVTWFRFGKQCVSPTDFAIKEVGPGRLQLTWKQLDGVDSYNILYRKTGELQWKKTTTSSPSTVLSGLVIGTYEISVQSGCSVEMPSSVQIYTIRQEEQPESPTTGNPFLTKVTISGDSSKIPDSFSDLLNPNHPDALKIPCSTQVSSYENCEAGHPVITPSGTIPLTSLQVGDVLTVYDMAVLVTGVNGSNPLSGTGLARLPFLQDTQGEVPLTPVEFSGVKAWKAENGASGGCVYQVDGYFRSRNATAASITQEQTAVLNALQPKADSSITGTSTFTGTLEEALIAYDSLNTLFASGNSSTQLQQELDAVKEAIVKATEEWKQQLITQYPDTTAGHTRAVAILADLDSLNTQITNGSLVDAEKAYKDALNDFNHPAPTILPFTPDAPMLPGPTVARLGSCLENGASYDPLTTPGTDGVACLGELNDTPYWSYIEGNQTWYLIAQANPDGSYTYARANETDWITCGRSPMNTCATTWQTVRLPEGESDGNTNPLLPSISQVIASPVGSQTATINWQGGPAFARYIVKYKGYGGAEQQETVTATRINLARLSENSNYTFTIEGYDAKGTLLATYSNGAFSTTTEQLAMPKNIQPTVQNATTILLTWDKDITHQSYKLVYTDGKDTPQTAFPTANSTSNNSFTITGLDSTLTYTFTLVAVGKNSSGGKLLSAPAQGAFTTKQTELCEGTIFVSNQLSDDLKSVTISWTPIEGQTATKVAYHQVISTQPVPVWIDLAEVNENSITISELAIDEQYEYHVTPVCRTTGQPDITGTQATGMVFTTKQLVVPTVNYACGTAPIVANKNQTPVNKLKVGDYFLIGDFPCQVLELTNATAPYKGRATTLVPYLGMSNFLMEFDALTLNTNYQVLSGSMTTITDPVLRQKLTDQRNQKDASKENKQPVVEKKYDQPVASVSVKTDASGKPLLNDKGQPTVIITLADGSTKEETITQNTTIVGSDGNQVPLSSAGVMTPANGKPVSAPAKSDTDPANVGDGSMIVRFSKDEQQNYGFDGVENGSGVWGRDNFNLGTTQYYVPIKSIEAGKDDYVNFNQQGSGGITFSLEINGTATPLTPEGNRIRLNVPITGNAALYAKDAQNRVVGKLTILSYPMVTKNVVLVSLNGSSLPDASSLQNELNKTFAQGVASVNVIPANLQTTAYDGAIDAERDHYKYSSEMRAIVSAFKENNTVDNNTVYLFFGTTSTADLAGVMNRGYQFGFIFNNEVKTVAHELGHGLFALEHTSNDNSNGLAASNLMDYSPTGKVLFKYQWQYVQSPPSVWGVFESGDDAEYATLPCLGIFDDCNDIIKNLRMMHNAAISNGAKGVLVKTTSTNKTLTGSNFEIDGIDISKIDLVFTGEPNVGYTLTMKEFEVTNTGFIIKSGDKNIVTISLSNSDLERSPSTKDKLKSYLFATKERCDEVANLMNKYSNEYGLTTPERMAHFIGQIGAETQLKDLSENSYSGSRILTADKTRTLRTNNGNKVLKYCSVFEDYTVDGAGCPYPYCTKDIVVPSGSYSGNYANITFMQNSGLKAKPSMVDQVPNDPDFFSAVYACQLGNGGIDTGDGYRFRGRGFLQITGYDNYKKMVQGRWDEVHGKGSKDFMCRSEPCDANLDAIANDLDFSLQISLTFWAASNTNNSANVISEDSIKVVTYDVNGAYIGLPNRITYTNLAYEIFKK